MVEVFFRTEDVMDLQTQRFLHPHPRVQQKMETLLLKAHGLAHAQIASIIGITGNTVRAYFEEFLYGGVEGLKVTYFNKPESILVCVTDTIKAHFEKSPPATVKAAAAEIEKLTGIKRSLTQVRKYLRSIGMSRLKTGSIPSKADPVIQEIFLKEKLEPKLQDARNGKRVLFFVDAAHFVFAPFLGYLWCFVRSFVKLLFRQPFLPRDWNQFPVNIEANCRIYRGSIDQS